MYFYEDFSTNIRLDDRESNLLLDHAFVVVFWSKHTHTPSTHKGDIKKQGRRRRVEVANHSAGRPGGSETKKQYIQFNLNIFNGKIFFEKLTFSWYILVQKLQILKLISYSWSATPKTPKKLSLRKLKILKKSGDVQH